jgi:MoaA/NifB/PqqE/SkfB family radical SAM enzyme
MNKIFSIVPNDSYTKIVKFSKKQLNGQYCLDPFTTLNVDINGNVGLCSCSVWMPTVVGNIKTQSIDEILNSPLAHDIRNSIRNGTYEYCDHTRCGTIINNRLLTIDEIDQNDFTDISKSTRDSVVDQTVVNLPQQITLSGDLICNLSCPSCRTSIINETDEEKAGRADIVNNINNNVFGSSDSRPVTVYLSLGGELFASPLMLNFMKNFPIQRYPNVEFKIQSNGLLVKKRWNKIAHLENNIFNITITADSQNNIVYEKLRRGGKLSTLIENLEFVSELKQRLNFEFNMRIVLQKDNANEINDFFKFATKYNADFVEYQFLQNYGTFTNQEYQELNVLNPNHEFHHRVVTDLTALKSQHGEKIVLYHGFI